LICFSRAMASRMPGNSSKYTSRVMRYLLVKPGVRARLCSFARRERSFVTPVYNTCERLAMTYT
jgi:hypothetical protein